MFQRYIVMEVILAHLAGAVTGAIAGLALNVLIGALILRREARKLGGTT